MNGRLIIALLFVVFETGAGSLKDFEKCVASYNKKVAKIYKKLSFPPRFSGQEVCDRCFELNDKDKIKRCKKCILNNDVIKMANEPWCAAFYSRTGSEKALSILEEDHYPFSVPKRPSS